MNYYELHHRLKAFDHIEPDPIERARLISALKRHPAKLAAEMIQMYVPEHLRQSWLFDLGKKP